MKKSKKNGSGASKIETAKIARLQKRIMELEVQVIVLKGALEAAQGNMSQVNVKAWVNAKY